MIGVITEEIGDFYGSPIISGVERYLRQNNYFFVTVAVRDDPKLLRNYSHLPLDRGVEGLITVDTLIERPLPQLGYPFAAELLSRGRPFTALFALTISPRLARFWPFNKQD